MIQTDKYVLYLLKYFYTIYKLLRDLLFLRTIRFSGLGALFKIKEMLKLNFLSVFF